MAGISSDIIRGYNDTIILYLLLDKPSYGYEISKQIKAMTNEKYIVKETATAPIPNATKAFFIFIPPFTK